ncbi:hypothetical protein KAR91_01085 [Candidatus Pacearchaeota archaeon]|nr:hypothetical protein [Candidatus Pacearchaeota archaeon]
MRLTAIVLKLRVAKTRFKNFIGGAAELNLAMKYTLKRNMCFVVPVDDTVEENRMDNAINQSIKETFGVIVALQNDAQQTERLGSISYDQIHDIRNELFKALIGWNTPEAEGTIYYAGGKLVDITPAYLWYRYDFSYLTRLNGNELVNKSVESQTAKIYEIAIQIGKEDAELNSDGKYSGLTAEQILRLIPPEDQPHVFRAIYTQMILSPDANLPYTGDLPIDDNFPNVVLPDMAQWIDMTIHPNDGAFGRGYGKSYDDFKEGDKP